MVPTRIRSAARRRGVRAFYRNRSLRELAALARWRRLRKEAPDLAHLAFYEEEVEGPLQRDEALFLHALVRVIRPRTIIEIGFFRGHSAFNFLTALDPDARLYSFDIDPSCVHTVRERFEHDPRFSFQVRSQDAITAEDIDGRRADFVFIDGAHELALNQAAFKRLLPLLEPGAVVAIHDTGTVARRFVPADHWTTGIPQRWVGDEVEHQPDERAFVNWLLERHPDFAQIHLHTLRKVRWGITLLQRSEPLPRPEGA